MASTYSNLKFQLMATGENSSTWGNVTNVNLGTAIEEAITGSADVAFSSGNVTLTLTDTNATQSARNLRLNLTGTTAGARDLIVPAIEKVYIVNNGCADAITVKNSTGTGIAVPAGKTMWVYNNGTNVLDTTTHLTSLTLAAALPVASGGTGQTSYTDGQLLIGNTSGNTLTKATLTAGANISITNGAGSITIAATGVGSGTVTSVGGTGTVNGLTLTGTVTTTGNLTLGGTLSGVSLTTQVTGTLPIANGGTGATTAATARTALGSTTVGDAVFIAASASAGRTALAAAASGANTDITALDQDVTVTATGTIAATSIGYRGIPQNAQTGAYTLVLADAGKHVSNTTGGFAIPANGTTAFPIGTTIVLFNNSGSSQNITITTDTLRLAGTATTGTRALAQYGLATCVKVASTVWVVSGAGVS